MGKRLYLLHCDIVNNDRKDVRVGVEGFDQLVKHWRPLASG